MIVRVQAGRHVGLGGGFLQRGDHEGRGALGRQHQAGQAFLGVGVVPGQVAQVGSGGEEQGVIAGVGGGLVGARDPVGGVKVGHTARVVAQALRAAIG